MREVVVWSKAITDPKTMKTNRKLMAYLIAFTIVVVVLSFATRTVLSSEGASVYIDARHLRLMWNVVG